MNKNEKPIDQVEKKLYRPRTVAVITDMTVSQIYKMIADGTLESIHIGKSVRVPAGAVDKMIAEASRA